MKIEFYTSIVEKEEIINKHKNKCIDLPHTSKGAVGEIHICEKGEMVVDGEIVKISEELKKEKEVKINELKIYNKEQIHARYSDSVQFDILAGIGNYGTLEEMKLFINDKLERYNRVNSLIENAKTIEELKEIDIETEYNKEN